MNKETQRIYDFINSSEELKNKIKSLRSKHNNFKDFYNQIGYVIMDVLNRNKQFHDYARNKIEIVKIAEMFF